MRLRLQVQGYNLVERMYLRRICVFKQKLSRLVYMETILDENGDFSGRNFLEICENMIYKISVIALFILLYAVFYLIRL